MRGSFLSAEAKTQDRTVPSIEREECDFLNPGNNLANEILETLFSCNMTWSTRQAYS